MDLLAPGGIIRKKNGVLLEIGGIEDHVHILAGIPPTLAISDMLKFIKSNSSGWVNKTYRPTEKFGWQPGFGAFTVSHYQESLVRTYIQNQRRHHQEKTFADEFLAILDAHGISYDPKFVFEREQTLRLTDFRTALSPLPGLSVSGSRYPRLTPADAIGKSLTPLPGLSDAVAPEESNGR